MKKILATVCIIFSLSVLTVPAAFGQMPIPIGPGDGDGSTVPISGLAVLAALGGGYAIKKLKDRKQ